ncbi:hypothetical protein V1478_009273 [Vespula squamosa]|uniref:Uncharacterized protein n=1 Tax=Vespula squamosa TaxID=30214 RepID=A0ABD2AR86_VESSQ
MRSRENYATSFPVSRCIFNVDSYDIFSDLLGEIRRRGRGNEGCCSLIVGNGRAGTRGKFCSNEEEEEKEEEEEEEEIK